MTDLRIASPCHASWEGMTPNDGGRHCARCAKTVVDVTAMAPSAGRAFVQRELPERLARGERVCVRAHVDRAGRLLRPDLRRRLLTNGLAAVLAMTIAGCTGDGPTPGTSTAPTPAPSAQPLALPGEVSAPLTGSPSPMMGTPSVPSAEPAPIRGEVAADPLPPQVMGGICAPVEGAVAPAQMGDVATPEAPPR